MSLRKRLLILCGIVLLVALLTALLAPFAIRHGLRAWLWWAARREGLSVQIARIEAPFLHPVMLEGVHLAPAAEKGRPIELEAGRVTVDLNFRGWLFGRNTRLLHAVAIDHLRGKVRQGMGKSGGAKLDWRSLQRLLPDSFRLADVDLEVKTPATAFVFRGVRLSASAVESGAFFAHQIFIVSPILRKSFTDLRGATSWEGNRLTIAGIPLAPGLDLEALTADLSRLPKRQVGLEFELDTFGGTLRASFEGRGGGPKFEVALTGSAANISLAQISSAAGFLEPLTGSVRASQFTFRGNPGEFLDATASIWIELSDFAWRARRGDHLVFGATYYNRRLQVEQLYVQQRPNELTVNGEFLWPKKRQDWSALQFRGQINATLPDANAFAQLFGAAPGDVAGKLFASGAIDSLDPAAHGALTFRGEGVRWKGVALDSLGGKLQLAGSEATLTDFEIRHANDFLRGHGTANLTGAHAYSARLTGAINDLGDYTGVLPASWRAAQVGGGVTFDWTGDGTATAHSGTMQLFAHGLQLPVAFLRAPLDLTLEGTYSPQDVFFRTFKLADERLSLGGFLMLGRNFLELQALELTLDGVPRATGTVFLPVSVPRWRETGSLIAALDDQQKFDVDLKVDQLDLAALAQALGEKSEIAGTLAGKLAAYGPLPALQLTTAGQFQNLGPATAPNDLDFELRIEGGSAEANLRATFGASAPVVLRATLPLQLAKERLADRSFVRRDEPFSVAFDFPALFPARMPEILRPLPASSGIVSGQLAYSGTLNAPEIEGTVHLLGLKISPPAPWPELANLSAALRVGNTAAEIATWQVEVAGTPLRGSGSLTIAPPFYTLTLNPEAETLSLPNLPASGSEISAIRLLGEGIAGTAPVLRQAVIRGSASASALSLTTTTDDGQTTLLYNPAATETAGPLLLNLQPPTQNAPVLTP